MIHHVITHAGWVSLLVSALGGLAPLGTRATEAVRGAAVRNETVLTLRPYKNPESDQTLRFLDQRTAALPDDSSAQNRLGALCLERLRATGDLVWLSRAADAASQSLASVPAVRNRGGLALHALVQHALHRFAEARDIGEQLCASAPDEPDGHLILGDALLELGDCDGADKAYQEAQRLTDGAVVPEISVRLSRLAWLRGNDATARSKLTEALEAARTLSPPATEMIAHCHVQLGQLDFGVGDWPAAEKHYRDALAALPTSFVAFEHLAELAGARGNYEEAATLYEQVIAIVPRPEFSQALADLWLFAGKPEESKPWQDKALAAYLESVTRGEAFYFHHLASFHADTQERPAEALRWARKDLEGRQNIFAWEALGWALYKIGELREAAAAFDKALALGTRSAHLLFRAGMAYFHAGEIAKGKECLQRAFAVNPRHEAFHVHR